MADFEKYLLSLVVQSPEISCSYCIHCKQDEVCKRWTNPNKTDEYCYSGIYQKYLKEVNYGNARK